MVSLSLWVTIVRHTMIYWLSWNRTVKRDHDHFSQYFQPRLLAAVSKDRRISQDWREAPIFSWKGASSDSEEFARVGRRTIETWSKNRRTQRFFLRSVVQNRKISIVSATPSLDIVQFVGQVTYLVSGFSILQRTGPDKSLKFVLQVTNRK